MLPFICFASSSSEQQNSGVRSQNIVFCVLCDVVSVCRLSVCYSFCSAFCYAMSQWPVWPLFKAAYSLIPGVPAAGVDCVVLQGTDPDSPTVSLTSLYLCSLFHGMHGESGIGFRPPSGVRAPGPFPCPGRLVGMSRLTNVRMSACHCDLIFNLFKSFYFESWWIGNRRPDGGEGRGEDRKSTTAPQRTEQLN